MKRERKGNKTVKKLRLFSYLFCYVLVSGFISKAEGFCFFQVIFPNNFETGSGGNVQGHLPMMPMSPLMHPRVKEVRTDSGSLRKGRLTIGKTNKKITKTFFVRENFKFCPNMLLRNQFF